jgi:23S rRNA pseudouridine955/2504/2580 synthase
MTERAEARVFSATLDQADRRLDRVLRGACRDVSLSAIMKAIRKGAVRVNGEKKEGSYRLSAGDIVSIPWRAGDEDGALSAGGKSGEHAKLETIMKTDDIWCIDKPAGLLSQPDRAGGDSVVTRAWRELSWSRCDFRPAVIHRLDRNVSGAMLIALNAPTLRALSALMRDGLIGKIYKALVIGTPPAEGMINLPLRKDGTSNTSVACGEGKDALTKYKVVKNGKNFSLVELELVTGRPHQARAHMSSIGYPIVGDSKYGRIHGAESPNLPMTQGRRLFLHAHSLTLPDHPDLPRGLRGVTITAPLPKKFDEFLRDF